MSLKLVEKTRQLSPDLPIAIGEVLVDDDKTRITQFVLQPGEQVGWHRHEYDYVTIQQSFGRLHIDASDGRSFDIDYKPGKAMSVKAPFEHNAINTGDVEIRVLEVEYKK